MPAYLGHVSGRVFCTSALQMQLPFRLIEPDLDPNPSALVFLALSSQDLSIVLFGTECRSSAVLLP